MIIEVKNLVKRYDRLLALDHFNLRVNEGEIYGLLGSRGSGKTTAINCILSLLKYDKGEVLILGRDMHQDAYGTKREIGFVMEQIGVFRELTVYENIFYFCSLYISDMNEVKRLTEEAISFVLLEEYAKLYPDKLSEGLLRRLNLACGIVHEPNIIIMDEPTHMVDISSKSIIQGCIKKLHENGKTILYSSYNIDDIEQLCNHISMMDKGKVVASGTKEELIDMISIGEKATIEVFNLFDNHIEELRQMPSIADVNYENNKLIIRSTKSRNNLIYILDYLQKNNVNVGKVYMEMPSLNDVFLEITGKTYR